MKLFLVIASLTAINAHANLVPRYHVSAGDNHSCALDSEGVKCWGDNRDGQTNVPALNHPTQVSAGSKHTCALDADGVKCWGDNSFGQLNVQNLNQPRQISTGYDHTCVLDADGVKCWGQSINIPPRLNHPTQISSGRQDTCAIDADGVKCWGANNYEIGDVPTLNRPTQVSVGHTHACAIDQDGVKCWGGDGFIRRIRTRNVPSLNHPTQISAGSQMTYVLDADGLQHWGARRNGDLSLLEELSVPRLNHPTQISAGGGHACAMDEDGVKCWGVNRHGETNVPSLTFSSSQTLSGTRRLLNRLATSAYSFDQQYLSELSTLLSEPHGSERPVHQFALLALTPHLRSFGYIGQSQSLLQGEFEGPIELGDSLSSLSRPGAPTMGSIEQTPELNQLAIQMLAISIRTAQPVLNESQKQQASMMLTLLANALSGDAASSREILRRSLPELERFFTEMSQNSYLRGRAASGLAILEYLK